MPPARVPEELRHRPFLTTRAREFGVTSSALRSDPWRSVFRDVWVHRDLPDSRELRLAAARLVLGPRSFICGLTAAWTYGIDVQDRRSGLIWVGVEDGHRVRTRRGCHVRELTVGPGDLDIVDGSVMTSPLRTAFDCARWLSLVEAVVVADALAHAGLIDRHSLAAYAAAHRGLRGVRQVDRVVELMDARSESPMETRVRLELVFAGLIPEPQFEICNANGKFVARADFAFETEKLVVEYDGAWHWEQRREDDRRRDAMRALGWEVLVFSSEDYYKRRPQLVAEVRDALARRAEA